MTKTVAAVAHTQVNLTNRANNNNGCRQCKPYDAYKINNVSIMEKFITRQNNLVTNRIRDGDFL